MTIHRFVFELVLRSAGRFGFANDDSPDVSLSMRCTSLLWANELAQGNDIAGVDQRTCQLPPWVHDHPQVC